MSRLVRSALRVLVTGGILAVLGWQLGTEVFADGVRVLSTTVLAAGAIGLATTVCNAARWCCVARRLGVRLGLAGAVVDYYRALFLNTALPGGVVGDVHRAIRQGRESESRGKRVRAVVLERLLGQALLLPVGGAILLTWPASDVLGLDALLPLLTGVGLVLTLGALAVPLAQRAGRVFGWRDQLAATVDDLRALGNPGVLLAIVALSSLSLSGHLALFVVAARAVGISTPVWTLLPLLVLVLVAMSVPLNVGGWGPREGAAAVVFSLAGLGAAQGVTVSVAYGILTAVSCLPGAVMLFLQGRGKRPCQVEFEERVGAEGEPPNRGAQRVPHPGGPGKAQPRNAVSE